MARRYAEFLWEKKSEMNKLLYKEIKLCIGAINLFFLLFAAMFLIPNYPVYVTFFYMCLSVFWIFNNAEINRDMMMNSILPVAKKDIVKARCLLVFCYEMVFFILTVPFAVLAAKLWPDGNSAGIDANVACYGLNLVAVTVFHLVFFPMFYKKGEKPGAGFLIATAAYFSAYVFLEIPVWTKGNSEFLNMIDSTDAAMQIRQIPVLAAGIIIYAAGWIMTYRISERKFEKVGI